MTSPPAFALRRALGLPCTGAVEGGTSVASVAAGVAAFPFAVARGLSRLQHRAGRCDREPGA